MKNKSSDDEMLNGFTQRIHARNSYNLHELVIAGLYGSKFELTNILCWEDDGGQVIRSRNSDDLPDPSMAHMETIRN
jgi:hypothetical protein